LLNPSGQADGTLNVTTGTDSSGNATAAFLLTDSKGNPIADINYFNSNTAPSSLNSLTVEGNTFTAGSSSGTLGSFVTTTNAPVASASNSTAQSGTGSALSADGTAIDNGNTGALPPGLQPTLDTLVAEGQTDEQDFTVDETEFDDNTDFLTFGTGNTFTGGSPPGGGGSSGGSPSSAHVPLSPTKRAGSVTSSGAIHSAAKGAPSGTAAAVHAAAIPHATALHAAAVIPAAATGGATLAGTSATALTFLQRVLSNLPAQAGGSAAAVVTSASGALSSLSASNAALSQDTTTAKDFDKRPISSKEIFLDEPGHSTLVGVAAPAPVLAAESSVASALAAIASAAQDVVAASGDQTTSGLAAMTADIENAAFGSADDAAAAQAAATAESAWQTSFAQLAAASAALASATGSINSAQSVLNGLVSSNLPSGTKFATKLDVKEAADAFNDQKAAVQALGLGDANLQSLLQAAATAWDVSQVTIAANGSTVHAAGGDLVVAAAGSETLADGSSPSTYAILQGATVTISGFHAGALGTRLDFLGGGQTATLSQSTSNGTTNTVITDGSATVTLAGVGISQLSLYDNFAGVPAATINANNVTASQDAGESLIDDGATHIHAVTIAGNDSAVGGAGNDVLTLNGGGTTAIGGGGNDTYVFTAGGGDDIIVNGLPSNAGPSGNLVLNGLTLANMWFKQSGNYLVINRFGSSDQINVQGWFGNAASELQTLTFGDGEQFNNSQINTFINDDLAAIPNGTFSSQATTPVGSGFDFLGTGQADQFVATASGQLGIFQFNISNQLTARLWVTNGGANLTMGTGTSVVGVGANFFGDTQRNMFIRASSGQVDVFEISQNGVALGVAGLVVPSSGGSSTPFTIDTGTSVIGTGQNFFDQADSEIFLRESNGQINVEEIKNLFNGTTQVIGSAGLVIPGSGGSSTPFTVSAGTTVVGIGQDFFGQGDREIFLRLSTGQVAVEEINNLFNGTTQVIGSAGLVVPPSTSGGSSTPFAIDSGTSVIGIAHNFFDAGDLNMFTRTATGGVDVWEVKDLFNGTSQVIGVAGLINDGANFNPDLGTSVIGVSHGFFGQNELDAFVRLSSGQLAVYTIHNLFNGTSQVTGSAGLTNSSGSAFTVDSAMSVIGVGTDSANGLQQVELQDGTNAPVLWDIKGTSLVNPHAVGSASIHSALVNVATTGITGAPASSATSGAEHASIAAPLRGLSPAGIPFHATLASQLHGLVSAMATFPATGAGAETISAVRLPPDAHLHGAIAGATHW